LTPLVDAQREETIRAICRLYEQAPELAKQGEQAGSSDELTGVQALERKHEGLPAAPGKVERREFEDVRDGTRSFILSRDVVTGKLLAKSAGPSRSEADFLAHVQALVATNPKASRWHIVCDQLNTHQSESLVRWVAELSRIEEDLGENSQKRSPGLSSEPSCFLERGKPPGGVPRHAQA
jgi:DDE superfamily endonuclease